MEKCRKSYKKEIDIIEHIMQFRAVKAEFEKLSAKGADRLQARTKTVAIDSDCMSDDSYEDDYADGDAQGTERKGTERKLILGQPKPSLN